MCEYYVNKDFKLDITYGFYTTVKFNRNNDKDKVNEIALELLNGGFLVKVKYSKENQEYTILAYEC